VRLRSGHATHRLGTEVRWLAIWLWLLETIFSYKARIRGRRFTSTRKSSAPHAVFSTFPRAVDPAELLEPGSLLSRVRLALQLFAFEDPAVRIRSRRSLSERPKRDCRHTRYNKNRQKARYYRHFQRNSYCRPPVLYNVDFATRHGGTTRTTNPTCTHWKIEVLSALALNRESPSRE
jgi:hypothetical protein